MPPGVGAQVAQLMDVCGVRCVVAAGRVSFAEREDARFCSDDTHELVEDEELELQLHTVDCGLEDCLNTEKAQKFGCEKSGIEADDDDVDPYKVLDGSVYPPFVECLAGT